MRWAGHVAHVEIKVLVGKPEGNKPIERSNVHVRIILN
jgi:hypothetical protein